jgi:hypothetical protein
VKTINVKCACGAEPREKCRDLGVGDERRAPSGFHISRVRAARAVTTVEARERNQQNRAIRAGRPKP